MNNHNSCPIDTKRNVEASLKEIMSKPENQALREEMKTEFNKMPCALPTRKSQTGGFTLTKEQTATAIAWAGRIYVVLKAGGYLYNIYDSYSFQCQAEHWVAGFMGLGDTAYCASKAAILKETVSHLTNLVLQWAAGEGVFKMTKPSGGKRKSKRKTRKSKKTRKGKKGKKGRKSRRKHDN